MEEFFVGTEEDGYTIYLKGDTTQAYAMRDIMTSHRLIIGDCGSMAELKDEAVFI